MGEILKRNIDFPPEWGTGKPIEHEAFKNGTILLARILLDDGSNLWAMIFEGGHRFARTASYTNWAIEERFHGDPTPVEADVVNDAWRNLLTTMATAGREAREMGL